MADPAYHRLSGHLSAVNVELLHEALGRGESVDLQIDGSLSFRAGAEARFIHFLGNWGRKQKIRPLIVKALPGSQDPPSWLVAAVLTATKVSVEDAPDGAGPRLKKQMSAVLQDSLFPSASVRSGKLTICMDFSSLAAPQSLYVIGRPETEPQVRDIDHFRDLFLEWISKEDYVLPIFPTNAEIPTEDTIVPTVMYELFRNTHDHARYLENGVTNPWSVRGTYIKLHEERLSVLVDYPDLSYRGYMQSLGKTLKTSGDPTLLLLEVSVFDSGPGLASHRSGKSLNEMTLSEERKYLEDCFVKHSTGVSGDYSRGLGLERVQRALSKLKGYLRIRSGRLDLSRDFNRLPFDSRVSFLDGPAEKPQGEHVAVSGTLVTSMIPVRRIP